MASELEATTSTFRIDVEGAPLSDAVQARLSQVVIDDSRNVPDLFMLTFVDFDADVRATSAFKVGSVVKISVQRSGSSGPDLLLTGEVTGIDLEIASDGSERTLVRGYDHSHRLHHGQRTEAYVNVKAGDIARTVAGRAGLKAGVIDSFEPVLDHVGQGGVSDWAFLRELAADVGAEVTVSDGALHFRRPAKASAASGKTEARQDPLVLEKGVNLFSIRAGITASDQVSEVEVRGWDAQAKQALVARASATTNGAALDGVSPASLGQVFKGPNWVESRSSASVLSALETTAKAIADRIGGSFAEIEGTARGHPLLRSGTPVTIAKVGAPVDGRYVLSGVRHEFTGDHGYLTRFTVSSSSERSIYGLATGVGGRGTGQQRSGVMPALVTDVKDPDGRGRVRVTFPLMSDTYVTGWARTVQLGAGQNRGSLVLPEVGDEVLVAFGTGDFDDPYVIGGLYNGKDVPKVGWNEHVDATSGSIKRRAFVSRSGMVIEMIESSTEERLTLATADGKQRVTLVQKAAAAIEIISEGPVTVTAKQNVSISTTGGNVSVETSGGSLSLKAATIAIEAQGQLTLKGVNVKIDGQAMAELGSGGITTVRGSLVQIN
ncbi:hypothetical protein BA895_06775 [Humibacillus sp. DSM 29435]|uniref:VgrG-related protein n=1 Tax=Humibacillus sp. DSM 29435 TaxID=1869167 RepID=UPI000873277B|nr:VgrG-related protein [Humibacillus sp. DSM 29435]OFE15407.1 hypothetical protein BA895_06775 [Humibacillus sp. DSM 29435]